MSTPNHFSRWYAKTEAMRDYASKNQLSSYQLRLLAPSPIKDQEARQNFGGLQSIQTSISNIHYYLNMLAETNSRLEPKINDLAAPNDPAQMQGAEDAARSAEITGKISELETARSQAQNQLSQARDGLRRETLNLSQSLNSRHLQAFFADEAERENLIAQTNRLRRALDTGLFGEGLWERRLHNPSIRDANWKDVNSHLQAFGPDSTRAKSTENCVILNYDSKHFWSLQQTDIQLNFKDICQSIDFMKNPDFYISLWSRKLEELKNNPLDAELKKYEKYKPLLEHLKFCKQPDPQNPGKTFTGQNTMRLTQDFFGNGLRIRCGSAAGKEAMLKTLRLFSRAVEEEKQENEKKNTAGFGAELLPEAPGFGR